MLAGLIARLDKRIRWYFVPVVRSRGAESWREHVTIVNAIEAQDPEGAASAMRRHAEVTQAAYHSERERHDHEEARLG